MLLLLSALKPRAWLQRAQPLIYHAVLVRSLARRRGYASRQLSKSTHTGLALRRQRAWLRVSQAIRYPPDSTASRLASSSARTAPTCAGHATARREASPLGSVDP
eukprot:6174509-Pleurochrysis_carterae.AAC.2